jgi:hypothetical protein
VGTCVWRQKATDRVFGTPSISKIINGEGKMSINNNNKQFLLNQLVWIGICFGISLAISFVLPFPVSLVAIFGVFILLNMYMRRVMVKRIGSMEGGAMFGSMFGASQNSSSLKYYCMSCGTEHRQITCPKCGSKMKKVGS